MNYMQLDLEDSYSALLFGTAALATLWFASAIIVAIDSIPIVCVNFLLEVGIVVAVKMVYIPMG